MNAMSPHQQFARSELMQSYVDLGWRCAAKGYQLDEVDHRLARTMPGGISEAFNFGHGLFHAASRTAGRSA